MSLENRFAWIDLTDPKQVTWAFSYLFKKGLFTALLNTAVDLDQHLKWLATQHVDLSELNRKMKTAWSQKKSRSHSRGKKPYSFVMRSDIGDKLKRLSGKVPVNQALELLIDDVDEFRKILKKEYEDKFEKKLAESTSMYSPSKKSAAKIDYLMALKKAEEQVIKNLLFENQKQSALLKRNNITDQALLSEERLYIENNIGSNVAFYKKEIQSHMGLIASSGLFIIGNIPILEDV